MSDIDLGGILGTVIVGGMAMKMVDSMDRREHERNEEREPKERKLKKKASHNAYTKQNYVFGNNKNSPW